MFLDLIIFVVWKKQIYLQQIKWNNFSILKGAFLHSSAA